MNKTIALVAGVLMGLAAYDLPAFAADVGVSISVGQPGFYGQLDIGDFPRPRVYYSQPMYIERGARYQEPVYLRVRPGHSRNWRKHCRAYGACGQNVYFVNNRWYNDVYVPRYQERHGRRDSSYQNHRGGHDGRQDGYDDRNESRRDNSRPDNDHDGRQSERDHRGDGQRGDHGEQRGHR